MVTKILDFEICSSLGNSVAHVLSSIKDEVHGQTFDHPFLDYTSAPLGVLDLTELGISEKLRTKQDDLTLAILSSFVARLIERNKLLENYRPHEIGLFLGTTTFSTQCFDELVASETLEEDYKIDHSFSKGNLVNILSERFGITGPSITVLSACSSGTNAIIKAHEFIKSGVIKVAIAGGIDVLNPTVIKGFDSLQLLSSELCSPFDESTSGINLAEGGGLFALCSSDDSDTTSKILGGAVTTDSFHITRPNTSGESMIDSINLALLNSSVKANELGYVNAHGTGTIPNDSAELKAVTEVGINSNILESTKRFTGHCLAGSGPLELAISLYRIKDYSDTSRLFLSNSFGFGGSNTSIVVSSGAIQ